MTLGLLVLALVLTLGTALFVAAEFSLVALDRPAVQRAVDAGDARARPVLGSLRRLSTLLSACQVGITVTTLALGYIANPAIGSLISPGLEALGIPRSALPGLAAAAMTVTRLLKNFREKKILTVRRSSMTLHKKDALEELLDL